MFKRRYCLAIQKLLSMKKDFKETKEYDVIIIGAGSGGLNIAGFASRVGLKV